MAQKTLNTRIQLKNATLTQWNESDLKLLAGEVALASVNTTRPDGQGGFISVPTYLMKVGDGTKKFSDLNWVAAPASDVHEWAKKETLQYSALPETLRTEISNLKTAVGDGGSVDTMIDSAISALKEACTVADAAVANQFVTAVAQTDGKIAITRRGLTADDIPALAISKITGLQAALDAKAPLSDFNTLNDTVTNATTGLVKKLSEEVQARTAADTALGERIDGIIDTTIPTLQTNLTKEINAAKDAASTADGKAVQAQEEVDALEGVVATLTQTVTDNKTAADAAVKAEKEAREAADGTLQAAINKLSSDIGNLSNVMNFRGAFASKDACTSPVSGDVIVINDGDDSGKEFVYDGTSWVEFGNVDAQQTAIAGLQGRMTTAEGKITALENDRVTEAELSAAKKALQDQIDTKAETTTVTGIGNRVTTLEGTVGDASKGLVKDVTALKTTVGDADSGLVKDVAQLEANSATKGELTTAQSTLSDAISDEATARKDADDALDAKIKTINETTIPGITGRLGTAETDIDNLQTAVNTINDTTIPTLATKKSVTDAEARIKAIEDDYLKKADEFIINCGNHTTNTWEF